MKKRPLSCWEHLIAASGAAALVPLSIGRSSSAVSDPSRRRRLRLVTAAPVPDRTRLHGHLGARCRATSVFASQVKSLNGCKCRSAGQANQPLMRMTRPIFGWR